MKRILIATDGSAPSTEALEFGLDLAADEEAKAIVVAGRSSARHHAVRRIRNVDRQGSSTTMTEEERAVLAEAAELAQTRAASTSRPSSCAARRSPRSSPTRTRSDVDLIVVGSRGHGALTTRGARQRLARRPPPHLQAGPYRPRLGPASGRNSRGRGGRLERARPATGPARRTAPARPRRTPRRTEKGAAMTAATTHPARARATGLSPPRHRSSAAGRDRRALIAMYVSDDSGPGDRPGDRARRHGAAGATGFSAGRARRRQQRHGPSAASRPWSSMPSDNLMSRVVTEVHDGMLVIANRGSVDGDADERRRDGSYARRRRSSAAAVP